MQAPGSAVSNWRDMSVHPHVPSQQSRSSRRGHLRGVPHAPPFQLPEPFAIEVRPARERVVVAPRGELDLATTEGLEAEIDGLVNAGFAEIVLDLRGLSFIDSTGLCLVL